MTLGKESKSLRWRVNRLEHELAFSVQNQCVKSLPAMSATVSCQWILLRLDFTDTAMAGSLVQTPWRRARISVLHKAGIVTSTLITTPFDLLTQAE